MIKRHPRFWVYVSTEWLVYWLDWEQVNLWNDRYKRIRVSELESYRIYSESVHRLVIQTFVWEIPKWMFVNHKDWNKHNNNLSNLEIVTPSQNSRHALETWLYKAPRWEKTWKNKITEAQVLEIYKKVKSWMSNVDIWKEFNIDHRTVSQIKKWQRWSYLHKEYF